MGNIFGVFYDIFGALMRFLYNITGSYGLAIILFTFLTRVAFLYFNGKAKKSTLKMQRLAPKQKEIEAKYKNDKQKSQQAVQQMYQKEGVSPMSGCLWSLIPLPIMIILFTILRGPLLYTIPIGNAADVAALGTALHEMALIEVADSEAEDPFTIPGDNDEPQATAAPSATPDPDGEEADDDNPEPVYEYNLLYNGAPLQGNAKALATLVAKTPDQMIMVTVLSQNGNDIKTYLMKQDADMQKIAETLYDSNGKFKFNSKFMGIDLLARPDSKGLLSPLILICILAAVLTWLSAWLSQKWSKAPQQGNMKFMMLMFPAMTFYFSYIMPAGIGLYWIAGSLYSLGQDFFMTRHYIKVLDAEDAKKAELERKRKEAEAAMKEELRQQRAEDYASGKKKKPSSYKLKAKPPKAAGKTDDNKTDDE